MNKLFIISSFFLASCSVQAFELEYGLGVIDLNAPSYKGSKSTKNFILPFPYLKLKSKYLKIDRGGIKARIFNLKNLSLNLSIAGSAPANTKSVVEREGMPALDFAVEMGPSLVYVMYQSKGGLFQFELPFRSVMTTDLKSIHYLGHNINPTLYYERDIADVKTSFKLGRIYSSQEVNNYYYSVENQFVTPSRTFYKAKEGISSDMFSFTSSVKLHKHHWLAIQFRYDNLNDSVNHDSPLLKSKNNIQLAFIYAYII